MASVKDFCDQVEELETVESYLLMAGDGRLVQHSLPDPDPDKVGSLMTLTLIAAEKLAGCIEAGRLQCVALGLAGEQNLTIYSLGKWVLGVQRQSHCNTVDLTRQIQGVIKDLSNE